jgi:hypothetical protein
MASIKEYDRTLPAFYTMSNKHLIITAHVGEETAYFYDQLGPLTTIIVLTKPDCYIEQKIFLDLMNDLGSTAISLGEEVDFDPNYLLSHRSQNIIGNLIQNYSFKKIIIHPKYPYDNDPQNREIHDFVRQIADNSKKRFVDKIYTYNKIGLYGKPRVPCNIQKGIIELYSSAAETTGRHDEDSNIKTNKDMLRSFISTASFISGVRLLKDDE